MLISFPFLPEFNPFNPKQWVEIESIDKTELAVHGIYPLSDQGCWHGGIHLRHQTVGQPIRAIADGTVVAYRQAQDVLDVGDDNSFILIRHETETGKDRSLRYYSLYMHLANTNALKPKQRDALIPLMREPRELTADGKTKVLRKDILGYCGMFDDRPMMHFEIFMTDADFQVYFKHSQLGNDNISHDGDVEMWGDHYWIIPTGQTLLDPETAAFAGTVEKRLFVRVRYDKGDKITTVWEDQGANESPRLITYEPAKQFLGDDKPDHVEKRYEYKLYDNAVARYPACPSAGYELLRFGRVTGPDQGKLTPPQSRNLQPIVIAPNTLGYVDVSSASIVKLSDADFPWFMGWAKVSEGDNPTADDGLCDVKVILDAVKEAEQVCLDNPGEKQVNLRAHLRCTRVHPKLRNLICEAPTEWEQSTNAKRYARLLEPDQPFHDKPEEYEEFLRYVEKFQFWDKTGLPAKNWHFHPLAFITHFKKCKWLSASELRQLFPEKATRFDGKKKIWVTENVPKIDMIMPPWPERLIELNRANQKFGITTPLRIAAFYGNALQETGWLVKMREGDDQTGHRNAHYYPWDGRGYLQLTWPENYIKYWEFRGYEIDKDAKKDLLEAAPKANKTKNNKPLVDLEKTLPTKIRNWRERIVRPTETEVQESHHDLANTAGAYWAWSRAAESADKEGKNVRKTVKGVAGPYIYYEHLPFGKVAATVNLGRPSTNFATINGIQARFQAFVAAQMALFDCAIFPRDDEAMETFPEPVEQERNKK